MTLLCVWSHMWWFSRLVLELSYMSQCHHQYVCVGYPISIFTWSVWLSWTSCAVVLSVIKVTKHNIDTVQMDDECSENRSACFNWTALAFLSFFVMTLDQLQQVENKEITETNSHSFARNDINYCCFLCTCRAVSSLRTTHYEVIIGTLDAAMQQQAEKYEYCDF